MLLTQKYKNDQSCEICPRKDICSRTFIHINGRCSYYIGLAIPQVEKETKIKYEKTSEPFLIGIRCSLCHLITPIQVTTEQYKEWEKVKKQIFRTPSEHWIKEQLTQIFPLITIEERTVWITHKCINCHNHTTYLQFSELPPSFEGSEYYLTSFTS